MNSTSVAKPSMVKKSAYAGGQTGFNMSADCVAVYIPGPAIARRDGDFQKGVEVVDVFVLDVEYAV